MEVIAAVLGLLLYGSPERAAARGGDEVVRPAQPRNSLSKMLGEQVVMNPALWLMAVNYFGVSMVRTCLSDWSNVFLREDKGLPLALAARNPCASCALWPRTVMDNEFPLYLWTG